MNDKKLKQAAILLGRMLPLMAQGMTFEQAGPAVLQRDQEIAAQILEDSEQGAAIRKEMAREVYAEVRRATQ